MIPDFEFIRLTNGKTVQAVALVDADGNQVIPSGGTFISGSASDYASLPAAVSHVGEVWYVEAASGGALSVIGVNKYPKGLYTPNASNTWELLPVNVKLAEDSVTIINLTNWAEWITFAFDININDRLIYNGLMYRNRTGTQSATAPDTDFVNWELIEYLRQIREVSTITYTVLQNDDILHCTYPSTGDCTITIPTAQAYDNRMITIKHAVDSTANNVIINTQGTETIEFQTSITIRSGESVQLYAIDGNWFVK